MKKKVLSLLLTLCLVMTFVPMAAFAEDAQNISVWDGSTAAAFAGGTGTAEDPYQIANGAELAYLASSQFVKKLHHQAAQQPSAASKIQKYPPKACKQRRFHAQFASFFRFMAANLSLTHCVTRARPLMWV